MKEILRIWQKYMSKKKRMKLGIKKEAQKMSKNREWRIFMELMTNDKEKKNNLIIYHQNMRSLHNNKEELSTMFLEKHSVNTTRKSMK